MKLRVMLLLIGAAIGLIVPASRAWSGPLDTMTERTWYMFPNSHLENAAPSPSPPGSVESVIFAWSGGVYDSDRDQLIVWGGGHTDYGGNEVYAFGPLTSDSPAWKRLTEPSNPPAENSPHGSDGRPVSRHTYNLLDYMPAPHNKMVSCAIGSQYSNGYSNESLDFFDFSVNPSVTEPWTRGTNPPSTEYALEAFCIYNPVTDTVWFHDKGSSRSRLQEYDPASNTWTSYANSNFEGDVTPAIASSRNALVAVGNGSIRVWNLNSPADASFTVASTGPKNAQNGKAPGFVYDPANDRFLGWNGREQVYSLTMPADLRNGTWIWEAIPLDASNSVIPTQIAGPRQVGYVTGTYGRFRYVPSLHGVVVVNATDENVYFFKLQDNGGEPPPSLALSANPTTVPDQGTTTLSWSSGNVDSCVASGAWSGTRATSGSQAVGPLTQDSTFTLRCSNASGTAVSRSVTVTIEQVVGPAITQFSATPVTVPAGEFSTLAWSSSNTTSCAASGAWSGSRATQGSESVGPINEQSEYTLSCDGPGGSTAASVTVDIESITAAPVINFSANPSTVQSGQNSTLSWSTSNASSCTASGAWSGSRQTSGSSSVGPLNANSNFTLTCSGAGGSTSRTVTVNVASATQAPQISFTADPSTVSPGQSTLLTWTATGADACTAVGGWSTSSATSGSTSVGPLDATQTFAIECSGAGGVSSKSLVVTIKTASGEEVTAESVGSFGTFGLLLLGSFAAALRCRRIPGTAAATVLLAVFAMGGPAGRAMAADVVDVTVISQTSSAQSDVPVTFGQVFKPGEIPSSSSLSARLPGGSTVPLQVDKKATHADGSLRHAILSMRVPQLGGNGNQLVTLATGASATGTAVSKNDLLNTGFDVQVLLNSGGTEYFASARDALSAATTWLNGPLVSEWIGGGSVESASGTAHPHLAVYFHIRAYAGNPIDQVRVDVVFENNWSFVSNPKNQTYTATIAVPGKADYQQTSLTHYSRARWHKRVWWGDEPSVYVRHDNEYIQATRAIPNYEEVQPADSFLNGVRRSVAPMDNADQSNNMDDTGYQPGIGPLPQWDAVYAVSGDVRAFDYMRANADGGGAYSIHLRDELTGLPITIDDYPNTSLIDPQGSSPQLPEPSSRSPYWEGSGASHQPSIGYLPYLVTGDYYYLEEMQFWSAYNLIWTSVGNRHGSDGWWYTESLRGQAWAYRSLAQAAYITPDSHPYKAYLLDKLDSNIQRDIALYVSPGGPHKNNLGAMYMGEGNDEYRFYDYFMSWTAQYLVDLGFTSAIPFRDYKLKFPIGLMGMTSNEYCFQSAPNYTWKVGPAGTSTFYPDWRTVYENNVGSVAGIACGTSAMASALGLSLNEMIGDQTSTTYWFANLQPAVAAAYDSGLPGGREAWERSLLSGIHPDYRNNPIWGIQPHGVSSPQLTVSLSANPTTVQPGGSTTLSWTTTNADTCSASGGWAGNKATTGSESVGPLSANTSFVLTCTSNALSSSVSSTAMVTVAEAAAPPTVSLAANPLNVDSGGSTTLSWSSTDATACTASGNWSGSLATSGTRQMTNLTSDRSYTLTCTGPGGSDSATVAVSVAPANDPAPQVSLTASPASVSAGASTTLSWSSQDAQSCEASGGWSGNKGVSGSQSSGALDVTTSFTLVCTGNGGSAQSSVSVQVQAAGSGGGTPTDAEAAGSSGLVFLSLLLAGVLRRVFRLARTAHEAQPCTS